MTDLKTTSNNFRTETTFSTETSSTLTRVRPSTGECWKKTTFNKLACLQYVFKICKKTFFCCSSVYCFKDSLFAQSNLYTYNGRTEVEFTFYEQKLVLLYVGHCTQAAAIQRGPLCQVWLYLKTCSSYYILRLKVLCIFYFEDSLVVLSFRLI